MCRTKEIAEYRWKEMQQDAEEEFADFRLKTEACADSHEERLQPGPHIDLSLRKAFEFNAAS